MVGLLRKVAHLARVLIVTHDPLVVNELSPEEVSLVTRGEDDTPHAESLASLWSERARSGFALGEFWLSRKGESESGALSAV